MESNKKAMKTVAWYAALGLLVFLLFNLLKYLNISHDFLIIKPLIQVLPDVGIASKTLQFFDFVRTWLSVMYMAFPIAVAQAAYCWTAPQHKLNFSSLMGLIIIGPFLILAFGVAIFLAYYDPNQLGVAGVSRGQLVSKVMDTELGLSVLGSVLFYVAAILIGGWVKNVYSILTIKGTQK